MRIRKGSLSPLTVAFVATAAAILSLVLHAVPALADSKYAAIVVDAVSGKTLYAQNADAQRHPASLTKMMTLYILFEELDAGRIKLTTPLSVSSAAAKQAPSKLGLKSGSTIKVEDAILGLVTKSANDAAWVVAENVSGSIPSFAARMNRTARALGMNNTTFYNPNGLPDSRQVTTARDLSRLGLALQDRFPNYYKYFGTRTFTYRGSRIRNHNHLLASVRGVDGIKTGYIRDSGFNIVTNVKRDKRHIIAVVMGGRTASRRDAQMRELIADYLPDAKRGTRTPDVLLASAGGGNADDGTAPEAVASIVAADVRVPRSRPAGETDDPGALAYAAEEQPSDIVGAAMAEARGEDAEDADEVADTEGDVSDGDTVEAPEDDPIALRIQTASTVAEFADITMQAEGPQDPIARLTQLARLRAGVEDVVAAPATGGVRSDDDHPGWHIQLGAVPTADGAQALLNKAKASMGTDLAALYPVTEAVESDGTTLYRARFAGFVDKDAARATCRKLKSKSFSCLAVPN